MVTVTGVAPAPRAICVGLKLQLTVASRLLQAKVTAAANVPPPGVTVKVEVVDSPESTDAGVEGVDKVKVGAARTVTVAALLEDDSSSPE
jgi:hypothetical protein